MTLTDTAESLASGQPLVVGSTVNFRAVGAAGAELRSGVFYRADALHALGDDGRRALSELGIVRIIDLRSDEEVTEAPDDIEGLGIDLVRVPVVAGSVRDAVAGLSGPQTFGLRELYIAMLSDGGPAFGRALRLIADGVPVVVHCTAGKDRTGLVAALALLAVGIDLSVVLDDYSRTEANLAGEWVETMAARLSRYGLPLEGSLREIVTGSPASALQAALEQVVLTDGDPDGYLDSIGVGPAERESLRVVLLARAPEPVATTFADVR